jgi:hypothetical protein
MTAEKSTVLDTAGGEMPNPNAQGHGPTKAELEEALKTSPNKLLEEKIPESSGDVADQAESEIENDLQGNIERARRNLKH